MAHEEFWCARARADSEEHASLSDDEIPLKLQNGGDRAMWLGPWAGVLSVDDWSLWDWKHVDLSVFTRTPTLALAELVYAAFFFCCVRHAWLVPRGATLVISAAIGATTNDVFFMALNVVDNFWHGQGTVMLTPRFPLYIWLWYVCFVYVPVVVASQWRLPPLREAGLVGVLTVALYAPFDAVGARSASFQQ